MATVEIAFLSPVDKNGPIDNAYPDSVTMITSSASNQVSTNAAERTGATCLITSSGGAVYAAIGSGSPDATSSTLRRLIPDGATRAFGNVATGHKVGIVNA